MTARLPPLLRRIPDDMAQTVRHSRGEVHDEVHDIFIHIGGALPTVDALLCGWPQRIPPHTHTHTNKSCVCAGRGNSRTISPHAAAISPAVPPRPISKAPPPQSTDRSEHHWGAEILHHKRLQPRCVEIYGNATQLNAILIVYIPAHLRSLLAEIHNSLAGCVA